MDLFANGGMLLPKQHHVLAPAMETKEPPLLIIEQRSLAASD